LPINVELGHPEHDEYRWVSCDEAAVLLAPRLIPILDWAVNVVSSPHAVTAPDCK
jgi:bis(5'-nucleosidyl)-tetraphosphatase